MRRPTANGHPRGSHFPEAGQGFFNHPHNWLLQFLYQCGVVGTALLVSLIGRRVSPACAGLANRLEAAIPALGVMTGLFVMATLEGPFFHVYPTMIFVLALAVLAAASGPPENAAAA